MTNVFKRLLDWLIRPIPPLVHDGRTLSERTNDIAYDIETALNNLRLPATYNEKMLLSYAMQVFEQSVENGDVYDGGVCEIEELAPYKHAVGLHLIPRKGDPDMFRIVYWTIKLE